MIVPSTKLSERVHETLCCVTQITDFDNHPSAFGIQQEILETLETQGVTKAIKQAEKIRDEIEEVFFKGKTDELIRLLNSATT